MEDITNRVVETDRLASETGVLHVGLPDATGRTLERVCRLGGSVEVSSPGAASAELAREPAALVADFAVLARKGTMSTAMPEGAFLHKGQIAVMTGLAQPSIHKALMGGKLRYENIDDEIMVRYDDLAVFMETPLGTNGRPLQKTGVAYVLATGESNRVAVKAADLLEPACGSGEPIMFRNRNGVSANLEPKMSETLTIFIRSLAMARMVTVLPEHARLTNVQAASAIRKQPSYIDEALASGELRSIKADDGYIVRYRDLMAFNEAYRRRRRDGVKEIQRLGELERLDQPEESCPHAVAAGRGVPLTRSP